MNETKGPNNQDDVILNEMDGHTYDGIAECDNPMPGWWLWTFFLTVIFAFLYYIHYTSGSGMTLNEELAVAMKEIEQNKGRGPVTNETEEMLVQAMSQVDVNGTGAQIYISKCAVCHGQALQGQIGPNLTDNFWIHGKGLRTDIVKVVRQGVLDKGMPSWDQLLSKEEVYAVTAFILSKKGSNPPNPKVPEGTAVQ